jgi:hypothetical protein
VWFFQLVGCCEWTVIEKNVANKKTGIIFILVLMIVVNEK